jgi:hypothetical protein
MFATRSEFEKPMPKFLGWKDYDFWYAMELPMQMPMLLAEFRMSYEDGKAGNVALMLDLSQQSEQLLSSTDSRAQILKALLVLPMSVGGQFTWQMRDVDAIWMGCVFR